MTVSILVVIGDEVDARLAGYLLSQIDQTVVTTNSLAAAESQLAARSWSAVILDTALPDGSGFELLETLTRISYEGAIIMLSASKEINDKVQALDAGADDYVVRPYEPAELMARVRAALRRSRRRAGRDESSTVRVGSVVLDMQSLEVELPGNRRERLSPNEMRLLHYLMTHAQRVVDHQELLTRLFGTAGHQASSNAVGVYMRRVRRKIEVDPDRPRLIVTVRGSGYRFNAGGEADDLDATNARQTSRGRHTAGPNGNASDTSFTP